MMNRNDINELLRRYDEALTTDAEERELVEFFRSATDIPDEWADYAVLFNALDSTDSLFSDEEVAAMMPSETQPSVRLLKLTTFQRVAAVLIGLLFVSTLAMAITLKAKIAENRALRSIRPSAIYQLPSISKEDYEALLEQADKEKSTDARKKIDSINARSPVYSELYDYSCGWYCGGGPISVTASNCLKPVNKLTYKAENAHDFNHTTAWVEGVEGTGKGEFLEYKFEGNSPRITTVKILNGYCKNQRTWEQNGRVKSLKMYYNEMAVLTLELEDSPTLQCFNVGTFGEHSSTCIEDGPKNTGIRYTLSFSNLSDILFPPFI